MKKRILFVDDDPNVLQGLRRMLRTMRHEWSMEFAASGRDALEILEQVPFDVVVTDMRMPGMDGAALLTEVMKRYPQIVRIVLSGQSDEDTILRSVGPAHQYLSKPCDADRLKATVGRACALRDLLGDGSLKRLVSQMETLPSLPSTYVELMDVLRSGKASMVEVGEIISKDIGMSAKVLQLVNSAFFGLPRHVSSPTEAAVLLGIDTVKALVLSVHVFSQFDPEKLQSFSIPALQRHSLATAALAKAIAEAENLDPMFRDHAFMAGLLHDSGKLILAANLPDRYKAAFAQASEHQVPLHDAERPIFGATHAEVGATLLGLWGLPDAIVEAVAYHHSPAECVGNSFSPLTAVHVADALEHGRQEAGLSASLLDDEYLDRIGVADRLPVWQNLTQTLPTE